MIVAEIGRSSSESGDEVYLTVWKTEQDIINRRWLLTSFFITISFVIFGFTIEQEINSSPSEKPHIIILIARLTSLAIYWFSIALYFRFTRYIDFLRDYLKGMEDRGETSLSIESKGKIVMRKGQSKFTVTRWLLVYFGIFYTGGVLALWALDI